MTLRWEGNRGGRTLMTACTTRCKKTRWRRPIARLARKGRTSAGEARGMMVFTRGLARPPRTPTMPSTCRRCPLASTVPRGFHPARARPADAPIVTDPGKSISNPVRPYLCTSKVFLFRSRMLQVVPFGPIQSQTVRQEMSGLGAVRECVPRGIAQSSRGPL